MTFKITTLLKQTITMCAYNFVMHLWRGWGLLYNIYSIFSERSFIYMMSTPTFVIDDTVILLKNNFTLGLKCWHFNSNNTSSCFDLFIVFFRWIQYNILFKIYVFRPSKSQGVTKSATVVNITFSKQFHSVELIIMHPVCAKHSFLK